MSTLLKHHISGTMVMVVWSLLEYSTAPADVPTNEEGGVKNSGASFDCRKEVLSRTENTICAHSDLSELDSQLGSAYAVAKATVEGDAKDALLKAQKTWLATRNLCSSPQCLHAAYAARIAELSAATYMRGIDFELRLKAGPHGWEPQCLEIPLTIFGSTHVEPKELPQAFAEFIPFVPSGSKVLDLLCADIKGDGAITYLLVTRKPYGSPGTLTLLSRARDRSLRLEAENKSIIQTDLAGESGGYEGIVIHQKGFTVQNSVGSAAGRGSFRSTFRYSTTARTWMLEGIDIDSFDRTDVPPHSHQRLTTARLGHVTFGAFDATPYGIALP
jgi:hypothetical protein